MQYGTESSLKRRIRLVRRRPGVVRIGTVSWTLVIHGGAGGARPNSTAAAQDRAARAALRRALGAGARILERAGSALDAVEAAVRLLEDDPRFNAGRGAVFTLEGAIELDAAIMEGATRRAGAVAGVTRSRTPVSLARAVMEHSPHVMLIGPAADIFALKHGVEQVDPAWFQTADRWRHLEAWRKADGRDAQAGPVDELGTVGAVARDVAGHVAAATSTGGIMGSLSGRVGDSPIIGAGTYADDRVGAVSATGAGEFFIREGVAHEICARMRFLREHPQTAAEAVLAEVRELGGRGGVIVVGADGTPAWAFNTPCMYRARAAAGRKAVVEI
jgi:beta-aspartyl-peptidase (threonine type)